MRQNATPFIVSTMIKKKQALLKSPVTISGLESIIPPPTKEIDKKIELSENTAISNLANVERAKREAHQKIRDAKVYAANAIEAASKKELLVAERAAIDVSNHATFVEKQAVQLARNPFIEGLLYDSDGSYTITFRPVFTLIRTGDGATTTKRRCIGGFEIKIPPMLWQDITGKNLLFYTYSYSHWSISSGKLCQGDWQPMFDELRTTGDIVGLVNALHEYLISTLDAAAYNKSHVWLKESRFHLLAGHSPIYKVGDAVICISRNNHNIDYRGIVSEITTSSGEQHIRFSYEKAPDGSAVRPTASWDRSKYFLPISILAWRQLESKETGAIVTVRYTKENNKAIIAKLAALDKAPEGITNADALALIS